MRAYLPFVLLLAACSGDKDDPPSDETGPDTSETGDADTGDVETGDTETGDTETDDTETGDTETDDTETGDTGAAQLAIVGTYTDAYGAAHGISNASWTIAYPGYPADVFLIRSYDNGEMYVIAENDLYNAYYAGLFSRFDWTWVGDDLYYCQTAFAEASEADALAVPASDATTPDTNGCGAYDFPWTLMTP